jgi:hypothetical protein
MTSLQTQRLQQCTHTTKRTTPAHVWSIWTLQALGTRFNRQSASRLCGQLALAHNQTPHVLHCQALCVVVCAWQFTLQSQCARLPGSWSGHKPIGHAHKRITHDDRLNSLARQTYKHHDMPCSWSNTVRPCSRAGTASIVWLGWVPFAASTVCRLSRGNQHIPIHSRSHPIWDGPLQWTGGGQA